jgi:hypothetical protein
MTGESVEKEATKLRFYVLWLKYSIAPLTKKSAGTQANKCLYVIRLWINLTQMIVGAFFGHKQSLEIFHFKK